MDFDVETELSKALLSADEDALPDGILCEWEPVECLAKSEQCETLTLRHRRTGDKAVLKVLDKNMPEVELLDALKRLEHPCLPKIYGICADDEKVYVLREYVVGESLANKQPFSEEEAVCIGMRLCDVLQFLHGQVTPIIHRDIKPENIILKEDGTPVLIDFGIARFRTGDRKADTRIMGTERFAPPEQYGFRETDARSDIYALGVVLGWMLTGNIYASERKNAIQNRNLERIVKRCTSFSPEDRYPTAGDLKHALQRHGRKGRRALIMAAVVFPVLLACIALFQPKSVRFKKPLIERAVRASLGVSDSERLTEKKLSSVKGLYIVGNNVAADSDGFYALEREWQSRGMLLSLGGDSLEDVSLLPGLTEIMIEGQLLSDLTPLSGLSQLEGAYFKRTRVTDISPLAALPRLTTLSLNGNPVSDLSAIASMKNMNVLDLCDVSDYDPTLIGTLRDMRYLDISNDTDSWRYLGKQSIEILEMRGTGLDSLEALAGVSGLQELDVQRTRLTGLEGIEVHGKLTYLRISGCRIADLSPVLQLPRLETLVIDSNQRAAAEALGRVPFEIRVE